MATKRIHPDVARRKAITRVWRKSGMGRLYWRNKHQRWRWDTGEIARAIGPGAIRQSFYSLEAIERYLHNEPDTTQATVPAARKGRG